MVKTLLHHWIVKLGPHINLVTDRGSEYINTDIAHLCTLMGNRHSPRTPYSPWTNGLVEVLSQPPQGREIIGSERTPEERNGEINQEVANKASQT